MAGTACHLQTQTLQATAVYAMGVLCVLLAGWWVVRSRPRWACELSMGTVGAGLHGLGVMALAASLAIGVSGWRAATQAQQRLDPSLEGVDLVLVGVVSRLPQVQSDGIRFWFEVGRAHRGFTPEVPAAVPPLVVLGWSGTPGADSAPAAFPAVRVGERWRLPVRLKAPHAAHNPHGGDTEAWWWSHGVMALGQVRVSAPREVQPERWAVDVAHPVERWRQACRDRLWQQGLEPRLAGIVSALLLGDQAALDPLDWDVFRRTGVAHLMSISGLHITLLAALMRWVIEKGWGFGSWRRRPLAMWWPACAAGEWGGLCTAVLYALFSGWGLPAQRTVLMLGVSVLLRSRGMRWPWWSAWLLACAVVLAWDPWAWLQAGFWLSFIAVGLLMALEDRRISPVGEHTDNVLTRFVRAAWAQWREQWRITLGLAPLTLLLFREVSLIGWLANLLAIPWVTLCVTPLTLLGVAWPEAWHLAAWALKGLQLVLAVMLEWGVPAWTVAAFPTWVAVVGVLGAGVWCLPAPLWLRGWGVPLVVPALGWQAHPPPLREVAVVVADVGQGQAVLVRTARHVLLYDAGPRYSQDMDAGQRVVVPLLQAYGARLDRLVLSHRDSDHTGGAGAVLAMQPQAQVLGSLPRRSSLAQREGYQDCQAGQSWVWDGVHFEVLHPLETGPSRTTSNAWSCVLRVRTAHSSVLLSGDIEASEEGALVKRLGPELKSDVLLVPHHGSRTSSTAAWLDAVQPQWAWVQAGYRNRFGHPAPDVLARYREREIQVLQTSSCGAILWSSQAPRQMSCERDLRRRYWHHRPP